jgi:exopolysaccharide biosynthesis polyprenyl glycosylphosphotransferase
MRNRRDSFNITNVVLAVIGDAFAVFLGFMLATYIRFDSALIPLFHDAPPHNRYGFYASGAIVTSLIFIFVFRALGLYVRPQLGDFSSKIPRLIRGIMFSMLLTLSLTFLVRTDPPFSRIVALLAFITISLFIIVERWLLFRVELWRARKRIASMRVAIIGTDSIAMRLKNSMEQEPRLGSKVIAFFRTGGSASEEKVPENMVKGNIEEAKRFLEGKNADQLIITDSSIDRSMLVDLILICEQNFITFNMVPDIVNILTTNVDIWTVSDIPLIGLSLWPLDYFFNRCLKRIEDLLGAIIGLILFAPVMLIIAITIKFDSPGTVFYKQERCGERGRIFKMLKFRTMRQDAEEETGPVWAKENDPRRTRIGAFLRRHNLDELPQLWNVLKGEMSIVGPRPERPYFVDQFKDDIERYMWRHVSKPGITGWAQINGLRGNTDIKERIKYDLYYLEHWSFSFDLKIIARTLFARKNAY